MVRFSTGPSERYKDWTKYSQRPITRTEIARNISFPHFSLNQSKSNSKIQPLKKRKVSFSHYGSFSPLSHTKFPGSQGALNLREAPLDMRHWGTQNIPQGPHGPSPLGHSSSLASTTFMALRKSDKLEDPSLQVEQAFIPYKHTCSSLGWLPLGIHVHHY